MKQATSSVEANKLDKKYQEKSLKTIFQKCRKCLIHRKYKVLKLMMYLAHLISLKLEVKNELCFLQLVFPRIINPLFLCTTLSSRLRIKDKMVKTNYENEFINII